MPKESNEDDITESSFDQHKCAETSQSETVNSYFVKRHLRLAVHAGASNFESVRTRNVVPLSETFIF